MVRKLMMLPLGALFFSSIFWIEGCGARVTVDKSGAGGTGATGGIGGTGGTGVTGGTGGAQSSVSSSNVTVSTSVSTGTSVTTTTTTTGPTSTSVTTSVSSGTTTSVCDNTGTCQDADQDTTNDCVSCAFAGPCEGVLSACVQDKDCCTQQPDGSCGQDKFVGCINDCAQNDMACMQKCQMSHPLGGKEYYSLIDCVLCQICPIDCSQIGGNCP